MICQQLLNGPNHMFLSSHTTMFVMSCQCPGVLVGLDFFSPLTNCNDRHSAHMVSFRRTLYVGRDAIWEAIKKRSISYLTYTYLKETLTGETVAGPEKQVIQPAWIAIVPTQRVRMRSVRTIATETMPKSAMPELRCTICLDGKFEFLRNGLNAISLYVTCSSNIV
jgi:hypothetical protein